ncbi:cytochrome c [Verrucomicrobiaceae bacterium N1E253]|uniref:Cytochrome c n=1 Tax=Oceaniferula marina TaxID=2748318 RepID=A0A851GPG6_9BACT|nr:cytochrome c [Oceaniferula marina]NWK56720.1 cytochrome c [Oceaniferula marina]
MSKRFLLTPVVLGLAAASVTAEENAEGKAAYAICQACHGPDGKGVKAGAKMMAASLAGSKVVNGDPSVFALAVLKGIKQEGSTYLLPMAPLEASFADDKKLAAVLSYVRQSFGNTAAAVTPEEVAKFRAQWKDEKGPIPRAKLTELNKK